MLCRLGRLRVATGLTACAVGPSAASDSPTCIRSVSWPEHIGTMSQCLELPSGPAVNQRRFIPEDFRAEQRQHELGQCRIQETPATASCLADKGPLELLSVTRAAAAYRWLTQVAQLPSHLPGGCPDPPHTGGGPGPCFVLQVPD